MIFQNRIVWLKKQKSIGLCTYSCDSKNSVYYKNTSGIFWDRNLIALSFKLPFGVIKFIRVVFYEPT